MKIGVFDFLGTETISVYESFGNMDAREIPGQRMRLRRLLVTPQSGNKADYVIDNDHLILDDIVNYVTNKIFYNKIYDSLEDFVKLFRTTKNIGSGYQIFGREKKTEIDVAAAERFVSWATANYNIFNSLYKDAADIEMWVIPITDDVPAEVQDILKNLFPGKIFLLWRSVAAYIGNEEMIARYGLSEGKTVLVSDGNVMSTLFAKLEIKKHEGRMIPSHHIYWDCDKDIRKEENYPACFVQRQYRRYRDCFPIGVSDFGTVVLKQESVSQSNFNPTNMDSTASLWLRIPSRYIHREVVTNIPAITDINLTSVCLGAARVANRRANKIVSYFDESEGLYLVIQTKTEEVVFKTLIEASEEIKGGLEVKGPAVDKIYVSTVKPEINYYFRLGDKNRKGKLKHYKQELEMPDELRNSGAKNIELVISASLIAGQGRAQITVMPKESENRNYIAPFYFDWDKKWPPQVETLESIEEKMPRSFPPLVPPVKCRENLWYEGSSIILALRWIVDSKYYYDDYLKQNINKSKWLYSDSKTIDRFAKGNTFGSPKTPCPYPSEYGDLVKKAFGKIKAEYERRVSAGLPFSDLITIISWTYDVAYFQDVKDDVLGMVLYDQEATQYFTMLANLLTDDDKISWTYGGAYFQDAKDDVLDKVLYDQERPKYFTMLANLLTDDDKISWTHYRIFQDVKDDVLGMVLYDQEETPQYFMLVNPSHHQSPSTKWAMPQFFTMLANLLTDDDEIIRFLKSFIYISNRRNALMNWCRACYLILMRNNSFLDKCDISKQAWQICVINLIKTYRHDTGPKVRVVLLQCLTFILKIRIKYNNFLRENSSDSVDVNLYVALKALPVNRDLEIQWKEVLERYLDGQGDLNIPLADLEE